MDKVQKTTSTDKNAPSSEPFRLYWNISYLFTTEVPAKVHVTVSKDHLQCSYSCLGTDLYQTRRLLHFSLESLIFLSHI
jgi:hypothetical protein